MRIRVQAQPSDQAILWITAVIAAFGVLMIYDASAVSAALRQRFDDPCFFLKRQLLWFLIGLGVMILASRIQRDHLQRAIIPVTMIMLFLLILVLIPGIGHESGGARRWIRLGPASIQPGEFMRVVLVLYLANLFSVRSEKIDHYLQVFLPALLITGATILLLAAQPKFGSVLILSLLAGILFFISGIPLFQLFIAFLCSLPVIVYAFFFVDYIHQRIEAWLNPAGYMKGLGFQTVQSLIAIGSGNLTGVGLGQGRQKMFYLPESHTDMIFPVISEELGLIGTLSVVVIFGFLFVKGMRTSMYSDTPFGKLLAAGLTVSIIVPFSLNLSVATGLFPITGVALPLISYGGTALVTDMFALGLLAGIPRWNGIDSEESLDAAA